MVIAELVGTELRRMINDVGRLDDRVGKLQRHFEQATEDVRQIRISTEKVGKRAERIDELQLGEDAPSYRVEESDGSDEVGPVRVIQ